MKIQKEIHLKNMSQFLFKTRTTFQNSLDEPLQIVNMKSSALFEEPEFFDEDDKKLDFDSILFENGKTKIYSIHLRKPVSPRGTCSLTFSEQASRKYLHSAVSQEGNLFFWNVQHTVENDCEFQQDVFFDSKFRIVHVHGIPPDEWKTDRLSWNLLIPKNHSFNALIAFQHLQKPTSRNLSKRPKSNRKSGKKR